MHDFFFFFYEKLVYSCGVRMAAYEALVTPSSNYAAIVWNPFTRTDINRNVAFKKRCATCILTALGVAVFLPF